MTEYPPRQRLLMALNHQEADRIPVDLGSTQVTGIHEVAYRQICAQLDLQVEPVEMVDKIQGLVSPSDAFMDWLGVDTRGLFSLNSHNWNVNPVEIADYWEYRDEWGITHHRPRPDGLYYSIFKTPLEDGDISIGSIRNLRWPDFTDPVRISGLREKALAWRKAGFAVVLKDPFAGIFEMSQRIVGMQSLLMLMASEKPTAAALFEKMVELKLDFWEMALPQLADVVDVVAQMDDYGSQTSQLISPRMFRDQIKPHLKTLFGRLAQLAPHSFRFFHSCGNVRPLLPDFIEIGVQILNPVHIRATGMDPVALKRDFGKDLVFWGGGIDTQDVLPNGTPEDVRTDVQRNIEALAPGGGFVFSTVHNIQADVPPENIIAMRDAVKDFGGY